MAEKRGVKSKGKRKRLKTERKKLRAEWSKLNEKNQKSKIKIKTKNY
jgi:hypothetical protein